MEELRRQYEKLEAERKRMQDAQDALDAAVVEKHADRINREACTAAYRKVYLEHGHFYLTAPERFRCTTEQFVRIRNERCYKLREIIEKRRPDLEVHCWEASDFEDDMRTVLVKTWVWPTRWEFNIWKGALEKARLSV